MGIRLSGNWSGKLTRILALVLFAGLSAFSFFELRSMEEKRLNADWDFRKALIFSSLKGLSAAHLSKNELLRDENLRSLFRDRSLRDAILVDEKNQIVGGFSFLERHDHDVLLLPAIAGDEGQFLSHLKLLHKKELATEYFGEVDGWNLIDPSSAHDSKNLFVTAPILGPKINNQSIRLVTLLLRYDLGSLHQEIVQSKLRFTLLLFGFSLLLLLGLRWALKSIEENMNLRLANEGLGARKQLMETFAHDVRKPFHMFRSFRATLERPLSAEDLKALVGAFSSEIEVCWRSVQSMIDDTLELASGRQLKPEVFSLQSLIEESSTSVIERHPRLGAQIHWDLAYQDSVEWDRSRINRVFWNLFENAFQAMSPNSELHVSTQITQDDWVRVQIRNTGSEISAKDLERIFQPGVSFGKSRGTGLGLAIVRDLVARHGGRVYCESRAGWGVQFTVEMPRFVSKPQDQESDVRRVG